MTNTATRKARRPERARRGRTHWWRFLAAALGTVGAAAALLLSGGTGALALAFAGRLPVAVSAEHVQVSGVSATPGISTGEGVRPTLVTRADHAELRGACARSTVRLPVIGTMTVTIGIDRVSAAPLKVDPGAVSAHGLSVGGVGLRLGSPAGESGGPFSLTVRRATGERLVVRPHAFAVGTIKAHGVRLDVRRGVHDCAPSRPERAPGNAPERTSGTGAERASGSAPERTSGNSAERTSENGAERTSGNAPERTPGNSADRRAGDRDHGPAAPEGARR
ncbi:DUF6230 family protein [Streptomyces sp. NPDC003077]|uniref:DUF6230 family protein n=1 Tax=Streptomyces sp. NPDC003077 TaxID=3154443 RepID=UPI0033AF465A